MQQIKMVPGLGRTPARVNRLTGTIFLNSDIWNSYSDFEQKLIILHEKGHYQLQTKDESEADKYALENFVKTEFQSLKKALNSFYYTLNMQIPEHRTRYSKIVLMILEIDVFRFGNKKLIKILNKMYQDEINKLLIAFLASKGIKNIEELSNQEKESIQLEFINQPQVIEIMAKMSETSDYDGEEYDEEEISNFSLIPGMGLIKGAVKTGVRLIGSGIMKPGGVKNLIGSGLIIKKPVLSAVVNGIGKGLGILKGKDKQVAQTVQVGGGVQAPQGRPLVRGGFAGIATQIAGGKTKDSAETKDSAGTNTVGDAANIGDTVKKAEEVRLQSEKDAKKKKIFLFGGIGLGVVVIAVVLFFVLRK